VAKPEVPIAKPGAPIAKPAEPTKPVANPALPATLKAFAKSAWKIDFVGGGKAQLPPALKSWLSR
jgi:hypothetical protein